MRCRTAANSKSARATYVIEESDAYPDARPGAYVLVRISDTGAGMEEGTLSRAFEPFFTTKGRGQRHRVGTEPGLRLLPTDWRFRPDHERGGAGHKCRDVSSSLGRSPRWRVRPVDASASPCRGGRSHTRR